MLTLKTPEDADKMREAGRVVAAVLSRIRESIVPGKTTTADLDNIARKTSKEFDARPSFLGYNLGFGPYPAAICTSVNEQVVHGIPGDRALQEGDIVGVDYGAEKGGWHADAAITVTVGKVSPVVEKLCRATEEALTRGIKRARPGGNLGDISSAIQKNVERNGFSVVRDLVGHGIGRKMHEDPQIPNFGKPRTGVKLREGMTLAIEPMVNAGSHEIRTLADKWTVVTRDGTPSAHYEHTIYIGEKEARILTLP